MFAVLRYAIRSGLRVACKHPEVLHGDFLFCIRVLSERFLDMKQGLKGPSTKPSANEQVGYLLNCGLLGHCFGAEINFVLIWGAPAFWIDEPTSTQSPPKQSPKPRETEVSINIGPVKSSSIGSTPHSSWGHSHCQFSTWAGQGLFRYTISPLINRLGVTGDLIHRLFTLHRRFKNWYQTRMHSVIH